MNILLAAVIALGFQPFEPPLVFFEEMTVIFREAVSSPACKEYFDTDPEELRDNSRLSFLNIPIARAQGIAVCPNRIALDLSWTPLIGPKKAAKVLVHELYHIDRCGKKRKSVEQEQSMADKAVKVCFNE